VQNVKSTAMSLRIGVFLLLAGLLPAQTPKPGSAEGIVTNSVTGRPVKRASVKFLGANNAIGCSAITDSAGRFHCDAIGPARYLALADAEGYATNVHTAHSQKIVAIVEEQKVTGIALELVPLGAISGRITDDKGQPLAGALITAREVNRRALWGGVATSDDRGHYRIFNLTPGRYHIRVAMPGPQEPEDAPRASVHRISPQYSYPEIYYPNAAGPEGAVPQEVVAGGEGTADFRLPKLPAYHIRGRLTGTADPGTTVGAAPCEQQDSGDNADQPLIEILRGVMLFVSGPGRDAEPTRDGVFDIQGLVSREYCLTARSFRVVAGPRVKVNREDVDGLEFPVAAAITVQGVLNSEDSPLPDLSRFKVVLAGASGLRDAEKMNADGTFSMPGVTPGDAYRVQARLPPEYYIKSIRYGAEQIPNGTIPAASEGVPLEITIARDPASLTVSVTYGVVDPISIVQVAAIPEGALALRSDLRRSGAIGPDGQAAWNGMAPGTYRVVAFESNDLHDSQDRVLLQALSSQSASVELHAAERASRTVTVIPGAELDRVKETLR
jgi:hypothetical protein